MCQLHGTQSLFFTYPLLSIHFTAVLQTVLIVSLDNKKGVLKQLSILLQLATYAIV